MRRVNGPGGGGSTAPREFDQIPFSPPIGYSLARESREVAVFSKVDGQKRFYCQILVYASQPTTGKPATRPFAFPRAANSFTGLSATTDSNGKPALTSLWVVRFPARYVGVVFNGPSEEALAACGGDAVNVAASIEMNATVSTAPAAAPAGSVVGRWEMVVPTRTSVRYNPATKRYDYDRSATMRQFRNVYQFRFEGSGRYEFDLTGYDPDKDQRFRVVERGTYQVAGGAIQFQPKEISEGRSAAGETPALTPRATPAAHARNFRITAAGLELQSGNGWESYTAVR